MVCFFVRVKILHDSPIKEVLSTDPPALALALERERTMSMTAIASFAALSMHPSASALVTRRQPERVAVTVEAGGEAPRSSETGVSRALSEILSFSQDTSRE